MDREEIRRNQAQESVSVTEEVNEANPIDSTQEINPTIPSYVIDDTTFSDSFDEEFLVSIEEEKQRLNSVIAGLQEKEMARHEQERREREAWLEKLRRENGLLSSDEEELKQEAAEETRRHTVFIESLDREKKNLIAAAARERRNPNRAMDIPQLREAVITRLRRNIQTHAAEEAKREKQIRERYERQMRERKASDKKEEEKQKALRRERQAFGQQLREESLRKQKAEQAKYEKETAARRQMMEKMKQKEEMEKKRKEEKRRQWSEQKEQLEKQERERKKMKEKQQREQYERIQKQLQRSSGSKGSGMVGCMFRWIGRILHKAPKDPQQSNQSDLQFSDNTKRCLSVESVFM